MHHPDSLATSPIFARLSLWAMARALLLLAAACVWALSLSTPALSWDEGWTLTVARTWVQHGFYGRLPLGQPDAPGLSAAFPSVASIALSFQLLGVGVWQGRLPSALYTLASFGLLFSLAGQLYSRRVAWGALAVLFLTTSHLATNPLYLGRQVFAEPVMLFALLAGYVALLQALSPAPGEASRPGGRARGTADLLPAIASPRPLARLALAALCGGGALIAKGQTLPFWTVSLLAPLLVSLLRRHWRAAAALGIVLAGSFAARRLLLWGQDLLLSGRTLPSAELAGLAEAVAIAPLATEERAFALTIVLVAGLPVLLGLLYAGWRWLATLRRGEQAGPCEYARIALLALAGGWFAWYALLSIGWARYLYPATFVGSIFAAAILHDLTLGFNLRASLDAILAAVKGLRLSRQAAGAFLALVLIAATVPVTLGQLYSSYTGSSTGPALETARFLNTRTLAGATVESYDSEIFFLLDRPYHYPPDQTNLELIVRSLGQDMETIYDPLAADPDYLVIGEFSRASELYDQTLADGAFRRIQTYGEYEVYERVRAGAVR